MRLLYGKLQTMRTRIILSLLIVLWLFPVQSVPGQAKIPTPAEVLGFTPGDDRTLASWREGHWAFFTRACRVLGKMPAQDMPIVCTRFRVLFDAETKR